MPREVTKYLCSYKCGKLANSKKSVIEAHEAHCLKNPALRTCNSCKHEHYYTEIEEHAEMPGCPDEKWRVRECKVLSWENFENLFKSQYSENDATSFYIPPIKNCPHWEGKS